MKAVSKPFNNVLVLLITLKGIQTGRQRNGTNRINFSPLYVQMGCLNSGSKTRPAFDRFPLSLGLYESADYEISGGAGSQGDSDEDEQTIEKLE